VAVTGRTKIERFIVTGNVATKGGGGVSLYNPGNVLRDCVIANNHSGGTGGGVNGPSGGSILDCVITNNHAAENGGGVSLNMTDDDRVRDSLFTYNESGMDGGGLHVFGQFSVSNCTVIGNGANHWGGGIALMGGGVLVDSRMITNGAMEGGGVYVQGGHAMACFVSGNAATNEGGGVYVDEGSVRDTQILGNIAWNSGGGGAAIQTSRAMVTNCVLRGNVGPRGGGALMRGGLLVDSDVEGNASSMIGGGVCLLGGGRFPLADRLRIKGNTAATYGGGVHMELGLLRNSLVTGNRSHEGGGVSGAGSTETFVESCTIAGNAAAEVGGGLYQVGSVSNSIVYFNTARQRVSSNHSNVFAAAYTCTVPALNGPGNIQSEPKFVDTRRGDYRLMSKSLCVGAGSPMAWMLKVQDMDGKPRVRSSNKNDILGVDMGAYQYNPRRRRR
jgi:hypothetical protein